MILSRPAPLLLCAAALLLACAAPAAADAAVRKTTSANWAGYAASKPGVTFKRVSGTWVAPAVTCSPSDRSHRYSAAWLGLGGLHTTARALEQVGTEADCVGGRHAYSAWYEIVPAAPVTLKMTIRPGDTISAAVTVEGRSVKLYLANLTRGTSFSKSMQPDRVDVTSAEWIVEAPSACIDNGGCRTLPLAEFSPTSFARARAVSATGHAGPISDPAWAATAITLSPDRFAPGTRFAGDDADTATPADLSPTGDGFAVSFGSGASDGSGAPDGASPSAG